MQPEAIGEERFMTDHYICEGHAHYHHRHGEEKPGIQAGIGPKPKDEIIYTCPMHPQIRQIGPGTCSICGLTLEPENATTVIALSSVSVTGNSLRARHSSIN
ncbi:hypothetical protein BN77_2542 [Rhizobium mesoamericanum STM3625]|uniref:Heavy metal binding domain-containing protein n=1 Tax=Rhizobium mesoamericanum STM3625 TaxID=1211777 RepID=K0PZD7_9HYPH|nr:hypothetical protein BN77_2542 [Rhizobium mesoamericanum STM3625]